MPAAIFRLRRIAQFAKDNSYPNCYAGSPKAEFSDQSAIRQLFICFMSSAESLERLEVALTPQERFEEYLQSRGQRQTKPRKFLVETIFAQHAHFDADELIEKLPRKGEPDYVSSATVYRSLREFVDAGLLNSFQLDGRTVYELDYGYPQHDHLYCTRCRKLIEFRSESLVETRDAAAAEHGFRVTGHRLIVQGVCRECAGSRRKKRKQDLV